MSEDDDPITAELPLPERRPDASDVDRQLLVVADASGIVRAELHEGESLTVGRSHRADVRLDSEGLSREHARFVRRGSEVEVLDLGSRNGTWIAGERVTRARVQPGVVVTLGSVTAMLRQLAPGTPGCPALHPAAIACEAASDVVIIRSPLMSELYRLVQRLAQTDATVLILGETGTGKEVVASVLHRLSARRKLPFRAINCAAIPEALLESALFGHERGAFTGALRTTKGVFEQAEGGTVFLDEVGELSSALQAALLRVLETKCIPRVGSSHERRIDVRIVAATNRELERMVARGEFRRDLWFRLNAMELHVPALRRRREEIAPLAQHFARLASARFGSPLQTIDGAVLERLEEYPWPGNVRELRNVIDRAVLFANGGRIAVGDLPEWARARGEQPRHGLLSDDELAALCSGSYQDMIRNYEVQLISAGLRLAEGNQTRAAELLRIPLRTLTYKIKQYALRTSGDGLCPRARSLVDGDAPD